MAQPVDTMCSVMLGVLKQESNPSSPNASINLLQYFIEDSKELQVFGTEKHGNLSGWIGHINGCLNSAKTRLEGISLLRALLGQCTSEVFQQHCVSWVRLLTQILQSHDPPPVVSLASSALTHILKDVMQVSELSRELSHSHIALIVTAALEMKMQDSAVEILSACIRYFPGPCGTFRTRTENFLVQLMSSDDDMDVVLSASRCLALLPRVGGGGQGGVKHVEAWSYYCHRLLASIRGVLDNLYGESEPQPESQSSYTPLPMPPAPLKEPSRTYALARHFKVLCACLQHMLSAEFPEIVKIPVNRILSLCYRVLGLNGKMLSKKVTLQWTLLAGSLSTIHREVFHLLTALISSCRSNLILHGHMINKLFVQTLGWTMSSQSDDMKQRPYSGLRVSAYTTLEMWLETVGACAGIETSAEKLLEHILYDARPQTQITKLKVTADKPAVSLNIKSPGKAKQKSQTAAAETTTSLVGQQRSDPLANSQVCLASLKVLRWLLMSAGTRVKPDFHKDIHEFVIPLLLRIQQVSQDLAPAPYSSADCRKALYHVLLSSVIAPHPRWPSPLQCAISLFSRGQQDSSRKVASFCVEASIICQTIIHPRVPCLQTPLSIAQLDPKRALSQSSFDLQVRSELGYMDTNTINGELALTSRTIEESGVVLRGDDWKVPPVDKDVITESSQPIQPDNSADRMDAQTKEDEEEDEDSSEDDSDKQEVTEDASGIEGSPERKDGKQEIKEIIQDNPEEEFPPQEIQDSDDTNREVSTSSQLQAESLAVVSSTGGKDTDIPSTSSDDGRVSLPTRKSKRHLAQAKKDSKSKSKDVVAGDELGDVSGRSKRRRTEQKDDEDKTRTDETKDEDSVEEGVTDDTAAMLASFVDSLPDED